MKEKAVLFLLVGVVSFFLAGVVVADEKVKEETAGAKEDILIVCIDKFLLSVNCELEKGEVLRGKLKSLLILIESFDLNLPKDEIAGAFLLVAGFESALEVLVEQFSNMKEALIGLKEEDLLLSKKQKKETCGVINNSSAAMMEEVKEFRCQSEIVVKKIEEMLLSRLQKGKEIAI